MGYIAPNSTVVLLQNISLTPNYENTVDYENATSQYNDMVSHKLLEYDRVSYVGKDKQQGMFRVECTDGNTIQKCTYMMFKNTSFENKWFYAFVTNIVWVNNVTWEIYFTLDVLQSYYFDFSYNQCFIERQHVTDDTIGSNLIPENLEIGEYVIEGEKDFNEFQKTHTCVATTLTQGGSQWDTEQGYPTTVIDNVHYGCKIYKFLTDDKFNKFIGQANDDGVIDQIIDIYEVPDFATGDETSQTGSVEVTSESGFIKSIEKPYSTIDGYTPKNNKLFTYPYKYLRATNYAGNMCNYRYENFQSNTCDFEAECTVTPNPEGYVYPREYLKMAENYDEGLSINDFPKGSYVSDQYKAWLAQTSNSRTIQALGIGASAIVGAVGLMSGIGGAMLAGSATLTASQATSVAVGGGAIANSFKQAGNMLAQQKDNMVNSQQATGNKSNSVINKIGNHYIALQRMCIKKYYAKIVDDYFTKYGYAIHELGVPNPKARKHWTFIKTVGCDIKASLPANLVSQINGIHDKGITFWKSLDEIGNYSLDNRVS